jgi:hypothetical protein
MQLKPYLKAALYLGIITGLIFVFFECLKYVFEYPVFYLLPGKLFYLALIFVGIPVICWIYLKGKDLLGSYPGSFVVLLCTYFIGAVITSLVMILIHYVVDPDYRMRIVEYEMADFMDKKSEFEAKHNARISKTDVDYFAIREKQISKFTVQSLAMLPINSLPVEVIFCAIVSYLFVVIQKFSTGPQTEDR